MQAVQIMITNIVEGATDRSESGLRAILSAQARLRLLIAAPVVIVEAALYLTSDEGVASRLVWLTVAYCVYVLTLHFLVRHRQSISARDLLVATAVLDPLALSAWLAVTGEYGSLIVGFYLFTILGFGFRTGRPLMYLCQLTAVAGFVLVFLSVPYWQDSPTVFVALMLPLIVVPLYSGVLIERLRESRQLAEKESKAKSELLAKVSHELRTPLAGIISATELVAAEGRTANSERLTDTILALSNELLQEINELLDEAKFGAQATRLENRPSDLGRLVHLLRDALGATAQKKGIDLRFVLDPAIIDWVEGDSHQLGRVLLNLVGNAVKFTDSGHVEVAFDLQGESATQYRLRFSVTDSGIGIPRAYHATLFDPFVQVDQGAGRRYGGTGLGLALAKQIVDLMGGTLAFDSAPGQGSRFWFDVTLPRSAKSLEHNRASTDASESTPVSPLRILVAEDNETNLLLLHELLQSDGHAITTCTSGMAALEILSEQEFDLLLLDYNLGDMDGVRVLQTCMLGRTTPIAALFLTADTTQLTAARLQQAGGNGVLYKPVTLAKLRRAIRQLDSTGPKPENLENVAPLDTAPAPATRPALTAVAVHPLDADVIAELKTVSRRADFFPALLEEASEDIRRCGEQIRQAIVERRYSGIHDVAHALKGVSANVGALRLLALSSRLMSASRADLDSSGERWAHDLADALEITLVALRKEIDSARGGFSADGTTSLHSD